MSGQLIKAMIVDDEAPARSELKYLLEKQPGVCVVFEAATFQEALGAVRNCQPHLVFLDIEMPGMNGVSLAERITEVSEPLIVFATAHEEFALKAFELNAVDYMLKPFSSRRIAQCIDKVRQLLLSRTPVAVKEGGEDKDRERPLSCRQKLAVEQNGKAQIINIAEIIMACSSEGQVSIHTNSKVYHTGMTLQDLQAKLDETLFYRSHRSYLVNIEKIREVVPWFNGTYNLLLEGLAGMEIPVSRQQAPKLKKMFSL